MLFLFSILSKDFECKRFDFVVLVVVCREQEHLERTGIIHTSIFQLRIEYSVVEHRNHLCTITKELCKTGSKISFVAQSRVR